MEIDKAKMDYIEEIKEKLNYKYPYEESVKVCSISVSEIKKMQSTYEEDLFKSICRGKITLKRPLFIQENEEKTK